ncbi:SAGA complex subunit spt3 [Nosema granulosis]|uniref:SAGA complex subunit spt3 n=1 Tax=Nosema granulosis TaxID=83296 RepID=A0A9P6H3S3_9MICR|nr:SAGA complex subunit spt3 [Nosema granulosis]
MYYDEIALMMIYSGNMAGTDPNAFEYLEKVVRSHSRRILVQSKRISTHCGNTSVGVQDIFFVLRKDKQLIAKLKEALRIKNLKNNIDDELDNLCMFEDNNDENISNIDRPVNEKLMILDSITRDMNTEEYVEYSKSRETSFTNKKVSKFKELIGVQNLSNDATEILGIISRDLIFEIVQWSIKVRNEKYKGKKDKPPFKLDFNRSPLSLNEIEEGVRRVYFNLPYRI